MFAMTTHVFSSFFSNVLQVFQTYVAGVLSGCCNSRSGVAHVAMRMRSGGARAVLARGLAAWASPGQCGSRVGEGVCWPEHGKRECSAGIQMPASVRTSVR
jgi:hypothetical protein